jgi:hypothetical protein
VPVRKVLQDIKMDTSKIHIKIKKIDRSVLVSLEKGKIMPHANEIEEAVLGALLNDSNAIDECMMILNDSKVFYIT